MKNYLDMPDLKILFENFQIDKTSKSGLIWIKPGKNRKVNKHAGTLVNGYWRVNFQHSTYAVHRIIYYMFYKVDIKNFEVDHIDRNTKNNSISNLRLVTSQLNAANTTSSKNSTSKYKGVHFSKKMNKWNARITYNYKTYHLGYFDNEEDAAVAYDNKAKILYNDYSCLNNVYANG